MLPIEEASSSRVKKKTCLRITIPTMGLSRSGGDRVLIEIANRLARKGHIITILVSRPNAVRTFPIESSVRIKVIEDKKNIISELVWLVKNVPTATHVALANYYPTAYSVYTSSLLHPLMPFYLVQGYEPDFFRFNRDKLVSLLKKFGAIVSYTLPLKHLYVSKWVGIKVAQFRPAKAIVLKNGVDSTIFTASRIYQSQKRIPVIMFIGSKAPNKGSSLVVKALNMLAQCYSFDVLLVTQSPDYRPTIRAAVDIQSPRDDFELAQCYRRADIFVFSSLQEGFGLPPLEAMACGAAVVCSACGGVDGYARNDENCIKVVAGSAEALHSAIERLILNNGLRQKLVSAGYETASAFSWSCTVDAYERIFQEAANLCDSPVI